MKNKFWITVRQNKSKKQYNIYFNYHKTKILFKKYLSYSSAERRAIEIGNKIKCQWLNLKLEKNLFNIESGQKNKNETN